MVRSRALGRAGAVFLGIVVAGGVATPFVAAADIWPGLWGPSGNGRAAAEARLPRGSALRVREAWRRPLGSGFSGIAIEGGRGYTAFSDGAHEQAVAFDTASGRELWRADLGETYRGHDGSKDGPAATPALDGERVFMVSRNGLFVALDAASGRVAWRHHLPGELGAPPPFYGFATSPLVDGANVIVQTGGERSGLAAFDRARGNVVWTAAHSKTAGYSSPVRAALGGVSQLLVLASDLVYGVRPADGGLLWSHPTGWGDEALRAPLAVAGSRVLISGMNEARLIEVKADGERFTATEAWTTARLKNSLSPTLFEDGHLFGFGSGYLVCLDDRGEVAWREKVYAGALIFVDGHVLILGAESGELRVARLSPRGYDERLKAPVFNAGATSVSGPAFAGGRLFLRNTEEMVALDFVE